MQIKDLRYLALALATLGCTANKNEPCSPPDSCAAATGDTGSPSEEAPSMFAAVFEQSVADGFTGVALVRHEGEVLFHDAAGFASVDEKTKIELETPLVIGSITKQFTGAAVLKLHDEGLIALDDRLQDLFEGVPSDKAEITVHQLLTHTAGFAALLGKDAEPVGRDEYLERAFSTELDFAPGTMHSYSNVGYSILAAIVEQTSGLSYEAFLREAFFAPAHMEQTGFLLPSWDEIEPASGFQGSSVDVPLERPHDDTGYYWNLRGNGGLISTASDLVLWHDALASGAALSAESLGLLTTPYVSEGVGTGSAYAYGWVIEETAAGKLAWHDGGNGFFYAQLYRYLDADLQVIVLANEDNDAAAALPRLLAQAVLPELTPNTWEILALADTEVGGSNESLTQDVEMRDGDVLLTAVIIELTDGSATWRVRDPNGEVFASGEATAQASADHFIRVDGLGGTWTLDVDLADASGFVSAGWGRLLGPDAPCPDGAECISLPSSLGQQ